MPQPRWSLPLLITLVIGLATEQETFAQKDWAVHDQTLAEYFRQQTQELSDNCLVEIETLEDWEARKGEYRRQLHEMLGLEPLPLRTPLNPVITGTVDHEEFVVEKLHFQSLPGLYVTGNLYRPKVVTEKLPTILYVCGHGRVVKDGVSYGNKTSYQHHGAWFARHGYVCLTIDTIQLGEIEGIHHGTYREGMWWWNSRGYTPAGVEAWNCMRALDYLETRPEVDASKFGVTGRSGGGAYSWWIAALDERIKVAVPVAGITTLKNHVVDGCVEGHCDCMYMVNTYRWDYPLVAALVAPRPLLISNTDKDGIFPLDGVVALHAKVRDIYELHDATDKLGLQITEGPHKDTQELHIHAFVWFDRWLKGENVPISEPALKLFEPEQLKVFDQLPADEIVTKIHETFVPQASALETEYARLARGLREKVFRGWPEEDEAEPLHVELIQSRVLGDCVVREYTFTSESPFRLSLYVIDPVDRPNVDRRSVIVRVPTQANWDHNLFKELIATGPLAIDDESADSWQARRDEMVASGSTLVFVAPRGIGPHRWQAAKDDPTAKLDDNKTAQIRRRFMLLGQTQDGMRVYDVRRALQAIQSLQEFTGLELEIQSAGDAAVWSLYAALFETGVDHLELSGLPTSHRDAPDLLNVAKVCDFSDVLRAVQQHVTLTTAD